MSKCTHCMMRLNPALRLNGSALFSVHLVSQTISKISPSKYIRLHSHLRFSYCTCTCLIHVHVDACTLYILTYYYCTLCTHNIHTFALDMNMNMYMYMYSIHVHLHIHVHVVVLYCVALYIVSFDHVYIRYIFVQAIYKLHDSLQYNIDWELISDLENGQVLSVEAHVTEQLQLSREIVQVLDIVLVSRLRPFG